MLFIVLYEGSILDVQTNFFVHRVDEKFEYICDEEHNVAVIMRLAKYIFCIVPQFTSDRIYFL